MLNALPLLAALCAPAQADATVTAELGRPMRPLTYPANPKLTDGTVDNFYTLYVDPGALAATLKPKSPTGGPAASLPIANRTTGWLEITVDGTKIGIIGPLTTGAIRGVTAGSYVVKMTSSTGHTSTEKVQTTTALPEIIAPGNAKAVVALEEGWHKIGFDAPPRMVEHVDGYILPVPPPAAPDTEPDAAPE